MGSEMCIRDSLGYDIYLRKQVIEKMIDELYQPESNNKAEKKKKK